MIVKVIIKRDVIKGKEKQFFKMLRDLRYNAMHQKGYITGETLICAEETNKVLIISKWESLEDWKNWQTDKERMAFDKKIHKFQKNPTVYEPYVFSKYWAAATHGFPMPLQEELLD